MQCLWQGCQVCHQQFQGLFQIAGYFDRVWNLPIRSAAFGTGDHWQRLPIFQLAPAYLWLQDILKHISFCQHPPDAVTQIQCGWKLCNDAAPIFWYTANFWQCRQFKYKAVILLKHGRRAIVSRLESFGDNVKVQATFCGDNSPPCKCHLTSSCSHY